ncbi:serine/threonine protein kinase [Streptomyces spinoverrucosus]|uniref:serine/threonine-protein kinase n=1 Tax=Streptomyces spinoverrucosus TaxID=284043 RepID=UPI0018C3A9F7|nr:serine/threonine-protein kinase [Streptomyces spinoverrucosus]MBG0852515.1 serine/threonine protein kinase [Streptomyces spinoverrucosus]
MRPGDEFAGRYVLREVIGAGRSGEVWLAHDTVVGQDVALKPELIEGDRETAVRRLLAEPRALAKFRDHPHVVTLFDVVTVEKDGEETYWFVMEYVPGGGLDRQPPLSWQRAARIGAELADALAALHEAGIVHCDVKPANVGLTRRGTAKLLDFGAAHRTGGAETITSNGPLSFTPDYAAPELARGHLPRPASDVFCLAATLYALVTGAPPRGGESGDGGDGGTDTERLTYWKAEQGVVEMDAEAVGPLYPVLTAMLRRDPRQRPDAAEAGRLLAAVATSGSQATTAQPGRRARWSWPARRPLLATAVGIGAALVLGGLILAPDGGDGDSGQGTDEAGRSRTTEGSLIGDPRTADVCALTDPAALGRFGEVHVDVDYGNFDRCDVLVSPDDKTRIDVSVQLRPGSRPESSRPATRIGTIGVLEEPPETDECGLLLYDSAAGDADGTLVGIRVDVGDGSVTGGSATLCTVADTAARSAAEVLNDGPLPRRSPAYPDNSLAWSDACALLDAKALTGAVPGIKPDTPEVGVANWNCEWFSEVDDLEAEVSFFRDQPKSATDGEAVRLSGHRALVKPEGDGDETCTVFLEYRRYSGEGAVPAAEMVRLRVGGERPMDELCEMVTGLATSAAAKLPER